MSIIKKNIQTAPIITQTGIIHNSVRGGIEVSLANAHIKIPSKAIVNIAKLVARMKVPLSLSQ